MKSYITIILFGVGVIISPATRSNTLSSILHPTSRDSLPVICNIITPDDMKWMNPFTTMLTNIFPDPNNYETYSGCHYQFYTADEKPQIAIRLIKWGSKKEAGDDFRNFFVSEGNAWGLPPERLYGIADSAYFGYNAYDDTSKCDECGLVAVMGVYGIYISIKGQYDKVPRARKKEAALKILQMMYDRIPGLAPSRIRNIK